jgi:hypothetical protein
VISLIPDWLTNWFVNAGSGIERRIVDMVHWAVHALASAVLAVFAHVERAWVSLTGHIWRYLGDLASLFVAIMGKLVKIVRVIIPGVLRWAARLFAYVEKLIRSWVAWLWGKIRETIALIYREISAVMRWAVQHIYDPLKRWVDFLWAKIRAWAYVAWWWVTHLADLAEALVYHLVRSLEVHAWDIADKLGTFALALVARNLRRFAHLIETIFVAVF